MGRNNHPMGYSKTKYPSRHIPWDLQFVPSLPMGSHGTTHIVKRCFKVLNRFLWFSYSIISAPLYLLPFRLVYLLFDFFILIIQDQLLSSKTKREYRILESWWISMNTIVNASECTGFRQNTGSAFSVKNFKSMSLSIRD